jgi:hypothetical protein
VNVSLNAIRGKKRETLAFDRARLETQPGTIAQLEPDAAHILILRYAQGLPALPDRVIGYM